MFTATILSPFDILNTESEKIEKTLSIYNEAICCLSGKSSHTSKSKCLVLYQC